MNTQAEIHLYALQRFSPEPDVVYSIDSAAHIAGMPRHLLLVCCKHGLVSPRIDPEYGGLFFDAPALQRLKRIAYLHSECGVNLTGIQIILDLLAELERRPGERIAFPVG